MKKIYLIAVLTVIGFMNLNAQNKGDIEFGVQAGLNFSNVSNSNGESTESRITFNVGGSAEYYFSDTWGIKAKLIYDNKGWKDGFIIDEDFNNYTTDFELSYLTIPVTANWHFGSTKRWFLNFGPYVGILLNAEDSALEMDLSDAFKSTDVGLAYGIGYKYPITNNMKIFAEFDGQSGFLGVFDEMEGDAVRNGRASLNLGLLFDL